MAAIVGRTTVRRNSLSARANALRALAGSEDLALSRNVSRTFNIDAEPHSKLNHEQLRRPPHLRCYLRPVPRRHPTASQAAQAAMDSMAESNFFTSWDLPLGNINKRCPDATIMRSRTPRAAT